MGPFFSVKIGINIVQISKLWRHIPTKVESPIISLPSALSFAHTN